MRHWYFDDGNGMFLSEESRAAYFPVQEYLDSLLKDDALNEDPQSDLPGDHVSTLRRRGSLLRATLAADIGVGRSTFD